MYTYTTFWRNCSKFTEKSSEVVSEHLDNIANLQNNTYKRIVDSGTFSQISFRNALGKTVQIKSTCKKSTGDATANNIVYGHGASGVHQSDWDRAIDHAVRDCYSAFTPKKLFAIHKTLFQYRKELKPQHIGTYRQHDVTIGHDADDGTYLITNSAPTHRDLNRLMVDWFSYVNNNHGVNPFIKAAMADMMLCRLQPFANGNSRTAGVVADALLARAEKLPFRFYSVGKQLYANKNICSELVWDDNCEAELWSCFFLKKIQEELTHISH